LDILDYEENVHGLEKGEYNSDHKMLSNMNSNLAKELSYLDSKIDYGKIANGIADDDTDNNANRIMEIRNRITDNNNKMYGYDNDVLRIQNRINQISSNKSKIQDSYASKWSNNVYSKLETGNVVNIYDSIFWNIINSKVNKTYTIDINYRLYPELMRRYIYSNNNDNVLEIHPFIQKYMRSVIEKEIIVGSDIESIELINKLYQNVFDKVVYDYMELGQEYNYSNYALKDVIDIMEHCLRHTLFVSMYNSFVKIITKYVKRKYVYDKDNNKSDFLNTAVENILNSTSKGYTLSQYIFGYMPLKLIKITLNIYDGEYDEDRMYTIDMLYEKIVDIIVSNSAVPLQDEKLSKNLKEIIIPYFKEYNDLFIKESKNMMDGYIGYIASESDLLNILLMVSKHNS